jgi:hypothetical protein
MPIHPFARQSDKQCTWDHLPRVDYCIGNDVQRPMRALSAQGFDQVGYGEHKSMLSVKSLCALLRF